MLLSEHSILVEMKCNVLKTENRSALCKSKLVRDINVDYKLMWI